MDALLASMNVYNSILHLRLLEVICRHKSPRFIFGERLEVISFYEIILGTIRDYYICYFVGESTSSHIVPVKHFYWCSSSNYIFSSLPKPSESVVKQLRTFPSLFTGEFDQILVHSTEPAKVIDAANGIILPPKHLTELDRLSVVIHQIDRRCSALPRGALKYTPTHTVLFNEAFEGLSTEKAFDLTNWSHFR